MSGHRQPGIHTDPHADTRIFKRLDALGEIKCRDAGHDGVQVIRDRRTEHGKDAIAHTLRWIIPSD